jgi:hypothetical protein
VAPRRPVGGPAARRLDDVAVAHVKACAEIDRAILSPFPATLVRNDIS